MQQLTRRQLLGMGLVGAGLAGCSRQASAYFGRLNPPEESILRIGNASEPTSLDPHKVGGVIGELHLSIALFDGLTEYHPRTLAPRPAIAERWYPEDGARVWMFHLRPGAVWSDGKPCTAEDFVYSWRRVVDPETVCPYANLLYYVRNGQRVNEGKLPPAQLGVQAVDPLTLRIEMEQPTIYFPNLTSFFIFRPVPRQSIAAYKERWARPGSMVSNGAFRLVEHVPYHQVVMERSQTYWDRERVKLNKLYFLPITDFSQNINLYQAGEMDVMVGGALPRPLLSELRKHRDYHVDGKFITYYLAFNCKRGPFNDARLRQALSLSINRRDLAVRFLRGDGEPASSFVPPGIPGYCSPAPRTQAAPDLTGLPPLTLHSMTREPDRTVIEVLQSMWSARGIRVELQSEESQTFLARLRRHDFGLAVARWGGDYLDPTTFLNLNNGPNPQNYSDWDDSEYRAQMRRAAVEADAARRYRLLAAAEARLLQQTPIAPLFHTGLQYLRKPWVNGWESNLQDLHPLKYVSVDRTWRPA